MNLKLECQGKEMVLAPGKTYTLGRAPECDFVVVSDRVSRRQLELRHDNSGWVITDLSTNGTFLGGAAIKSQAVDGTLDLVVGGRSGIELRVALVPATAVAPLPVPLQRPAGQQQPRPGPAPEPAGGPRAASITRRVDLKHGLRIGRRPDNDWVINDLLVSRQHAQILRATGGHWEILDLKSSNGTFVNEQRITRQRLQPHDVLAIGRAKMRFSGGALYLHGAPEGEDGGVASPDGMELVAKDLVCVGAKQNILLNKVSLRVRPCSLTAVIGPSGAGKSTLLGALTGRRPATSGTVLVAGRDLYSGYAELRNRIGLVPQADVLHPNLTCRRALEYGAALRFPRDTTPAERSARVDEVLKELDLIKDAQQRINKLSGGQRKRTNVALELLTEPGLLFLDEPTSGLDPGLDRQVMKLLRALADKGQTVLVVTHAMDNLSECDSVVILGKGGVLAYHGAPSGVFDYFNVKSWPDVFGKLDKPVPIPAAVTQTRGRVQRLKPIRQQTWWFQVITLVRRYLEVIRADVSYVLLLLLLPLIMARVVFIAGDESGLGVGEALDGFPAVNMEARSLLLLLVLGAAFMGGAASIQELVKERAIYERERSFGLSNSAYLVSKVLVLGVITAVQAGLFVLLSLWGRPGPQDPLIFVNGTLEVASVVAALAVVSMVVGLLLSALIRTREVGMIVLVVVTMVQVVLSGAIPLRWEWILDGPAQIVPTYWAMNALSASVDLNVVTGLHGDARFAWWKHVAYGWQVGMLYLLLMFSAVLAAALLWLERNENSS